MLTPTEESAPRTRSRRARSKAASFRSDTRPLVVFDWSFSRIHVTFDGVNVVVMPGIAELVASLQEPHRIVAEATFESWDPQRRRHLVGLLRDAGHELYVFRPLRTARARTAWGIPKSDTADAKVIYRIAASTTTHLYRAIGVPNSAEVSQREKLNEDYNWIRLAGEKEMLAEQAAAILGTHRDLKESHPILAACLGSTTYSQTALAAPFFVAQHARNRDEFERLLGLSGCASPSLLRSEIHNHVWKHAKKRNVTDPETGEQRPLTLREFRRCLRSMYATFKAARPAPDPWSAVSQEHAPAGD